MLRSSRSYGWYFVCVLIALVETNSIAQARTPDAEVASYAKERGGEWDNGTLQGEQAALLTELNTLSLAARKLITHLAVSGASLEKAPNLQVLPSLIWLQLSDDGIRDISGLAGLGLKTLLLNENPLSDINPISTCIELVYLNLSHTQVASLPDLSTLSNLTELNLLDTPLRDLKGIESVRSDFDLNVMGCDQLTKMDSLLLSKVKTLFIDKENYSRLAGWFRVHDHQIKTRRPLMTIKTEMIE
jgi:Leucine-rich repeat (LRR) protein